MSKTISMEKFGTMNETKDLNILDVRQGFEYKMMGHIPGAKNIPLSKLPNQLEDLSKKEEYYVVCQSGGRSQQAVDFLSQSGYKVTNVLGGMSQWQGPKER